MIKCRLMLVLFAMVATGLGLLAPAGADAQVASATAYRINPGDDLEILVWGDDRLQRTVRVLPDGTFAFPLVGQILASGRLPAELERAITIGLRPQYRGTVPQVTVSVKSPAGFQFSVVGKVRNPGTFTPGRYVNALEALSMAGGPSEFAQVNDIKIIRKSGPALQTISLRLGSVLRGNTSTLSETEVPPIRSGDTLVVP